MYYCIQSITVNIMTQYNLYFTSQASKIKVLIMTICGSQQVYQKHVCLISSVRTEQNSGLLGSKWWKYGEGIE